MSHAARRPSLCTLLAVLVPLLACSTARAGFDEDKCLTTRDGYSCIKASRAFHRDNQLAAILKTGDAAKLKAYRDKVEQLDVLICNSYNEEANCRYVIDVLQLDPPSDAVKQRIADLQTKMCVKGTDPICAELRYKKALGGLPEEQACLQKDFGDACFKLAAPHSTELNKLGDKGDATKRKQHAAKVVEYLGKLCEAGVKRACDSMESALVVAPRGPAENQLLLKTQQKLCSLGNSLACTSVRQKESAQATAATAGGEEQKCLKDNDAALCLLLAKERYVMAAQLRKPGQEQPFGLARGKVIALATKACELGKPDGCSLAQRAIELVEKPSDADYATILRLLDARCKLGAQPACQAWKERQASGGKPPARMPRTKDVAAVAALLKQSGTLAGANLAGKELEGIDLGRANLKGANLKGAYLAGARLLSANLDGAVLDGANLEKADVSQLSLVGASARGATFSDGTGFFASARGARLDDASIGEAIGDSTDLTDTHLEGAKLFRCKWSGRDLRKVFLRGTSFAECDLTSANLSGVDLTGADLRHAKVERTNFASAKLDRAQLEDVLFSDSDLTGTSLQEAQGSRAFFSTRKMAGANFSRSNLKDAKFMGATNLAGVRFERAIVCGTDIEKVQGWSGALSAGVQKVCN